MPNIVKTYALNGRKFAQQRLVLGQIVQLTSLLEEVGQVNWEDLTDIALALGPRLSEALAIVLTPRGESVQNKDLAELKAYLEEFADMDFCLGVIDDFFDCNPALPCMQRVLGIIKKIAIPTVTPASDQPKSILSK